jgi:hypothetical protein
LTYLADVFGILNSLNISLQGKEVTMLEAEGKVQSFQEKLALLGRNVKSRNIADFCLFDKFTSDSVHPVEPKVYESVILNLEYLKTTTEGIISTG